MKTTEEGNSLKPKINPKSIRRNIGGRGGMANRGGRNGGFNNERPKRMFRNNNQNNGNNNIRSRNVNKFSFINNKIRQITINKT